MSEEWLSHKRPALCEGYTTEEIFNADETGLFYNLTPDKTLKFKGEECKGGKLSKTRITVLVAANMTGSCKRKLLVIGKAKKPRCFKNIQSLPVTYENNTRSWMTSQIFEKWLRIWDAELKSGGNKILLLVDNCFKDLSPSQAENDDDIPLARMIQSTDEDDNVALAELVAQLQRSTATEQRIQIEEFIGIDDSVAVCALATEEEILAEAERNNHNTDDENEDQQDPEEQFQPSTIFEALNAITVLQKFVPLTTSLILMILIP
ncbi:unnamed protein product [Pieris brassicae]|uniref:DDE-1 domain-containing protein n=1 Tax=Pieris brassicae TaxID=7116 RepID=A0A9P0SZ99_PIEBR|nr:unnamed protein product [Pieris brassicae]